MRPTQCKLIGCGFFHLYSWQMPHDHTDHAKHPNGFEGILHPLPPDEHAQALAAHNAADVAKHVIVHRKPRSASSLVEDGKGGLCCKPSDQCLTKGQQKAPQGSP